METWVIVTLVIVFTICMAIGVFALVRHFEKVRREAMEKFATELGLEFHPLGHEQLMSSVQGFKLFNSGRARKMKNVIMGETEVATLCIFDYQYTTGSGKHQHTHVQTVVSMESKDLTIPSFTMRPESLFDWFGSVLGFQDIDFDSHPKFSKMFVLKGENETAIRSFFDQPILDFFADRKGITFEGFPGQFIYFRGGRTTKTDELNTYLQEGYSVYSAFMERLKRGNVDSSLPG